MSLYEWWMLGVAGAAVLVVAVVLVPRRREGDRRREDGMLRTTGRSVELVRAPNGALHEMVEFRDARGTPVRGRPAPPSRTLTDRSGRDVVVRYRPDNPHFFVTEPLR